mmetsp:Transcript_7871/g.18743  ORF Transcript_7871/g.18743 Transcript_7871/m.18743 type:complete len:227 (-) Transcript_7871:96-776(-)
MPPPGTRTPFRSATCVRSRRRHRVQLGCAVSANDRRELQHVIDDALVAVGLVAHVQQVLAARLHRVELHAVAPRVHHRLDRAERRDDVALRVDDARAHALDDGRLHEALARAQAVWKERRGEMPRERWRHAVKFFERGRHAIDVARAVVDLRDNLLLEIGVQLEQVGDDVARPTEDVQVHCLLLLHCLADLPVQAVLCGISREDGDKVERDEGRLDTSSRVDVGKF